MILLRWLFYDFKEGSWELRTASVLLTLYLLLVVIVPTIFLVWLLTLTPLV